MGIEKTKKIEGGNSQEGTLHNSGGGTRGCVAPGKNTAKKLPTCEGTESEKMVERYGKKGKKRRLSFQNPRRRDGGWEREPGV